jgi:DNA polymerase (family 10)
VNNRTIAQRLFQYADTLDSQRGNIYRPRAYRRAAETLLRLDRPVAHIVGEQGRQGLEVLPGIGSHLAYTIEGLVRTGEFRTLN